MVGVYLHLIAEKPAFLRQAGSDTSKLEVSQGSYVSLYKNGVLQPHEFKNIYEGYYHVAVSLFMNARCKVNFGPHFDHAPQSDFRPYSDLLTNDTDESAVLLRHGSSKY